MNCTLQFIIVFLVFFNILIDFLLSSPVLLHYSKITTKQITRYTYIVLLPEKKFYLNIRFSLDFFDDAEESTAERMREAPEGKRRDLHNRFPASL